MARRDITNIMVCQAYVKARAIDFNKFPYQILSEETGEPEKVCYRAMERACEADFIEYGVSLRTGWLTDSGKKLIGIF